MSVVENFEKLLTDFFTLYHPRQVAKVGAIAQEFKGQEAVLLKALCDKYKKAYKVIPGLNELLAAPAPVVEEPVALEEASEEVEEVEETTEEEVAEEAPVAEEAAEESAEEEVATEEEEEKE